MGKKKNKNNGGDNQQKDDQKNNNDDGGKKDGGEGGGGSGSGPITVVLRTDMHCEGCATKIKKCLLGFKGVESLKTDEKDPNKLSVTGKVDPAKLRDLVEKKTKKKVELVSPLPKKDKDKAGDGTGGGEKKKAEDKPAKTPDDKKSKEPPFTTAVFKLNTHCEGCVQKIHKLISKTKGFLEMSMDRQKDLVTVKGTMDMKAMADMLKEKLRRPVEIVLPKKEGDNKKEKGGGGEKEKGGGGDGKAAATTSGGDGDGSNKSGQNRLEYVPYGYPYPYPYPYPPVASDYAVHIPVHAPQMFSDENPNACSVM